ncbi:MAG: FtsX-like permease family protein, partial [Anaerolineae bacterium]|nr:FtsX-like permease family protein [Anaerolineae bacterium]
PPVGVDPETELDYRARTGRIIPGVEIRAVDDAGNVVARDGTAVGELQARPDYGDMKISRLELDAGQWPQRKTLAVERGQPFGVGTRIYLEIDDQVYRPELGGVIYNTTVAPSSFGGDPTFYATRERFAQLTGEPNYNFFYARLPVYNPAVATAVADNIQHHLEKQDYRVGAALPNDNRTIHPDEHFIQEDLNAVFFLLTTLAAISLVLGLFLVYNTITAIVSQQIDQIGMMKAIGASFRQILLVFFGEIIVYAGLALLLAIPLGIFGAHGLRLVLVGMFNMAPGPLVVLPQVVAVQAAVALLSPLLVAILPVLAGARVTVRQAISSYGLGGTGGLLDRLLVKSKSIPRSLALTIGNTFRNKWRVSFTQVTLVGSGLIFMMVMHTRASLVYTFSDVLFSIIDANVFLNLENDERIKNIEALALSHPQVTTIEMWSFAGATIRPLGQPESNDDRSALVRGVPLPTETYRPQMRAGRWLLPDDTYALVMHQKLADEVGVGVGDWVTLDIPQKRESTWQVVGLLFSPFNDSAVNVPRDILLKETREVGLASHIRIKTIGRDAASEAAVADNLRLMYEANGYPVRPESDDTAHRITEEILDGGISIVINLLASMAVVIAIVGGVALSGILSINVLERRREIGVMRAVGASSGQIMRIFIGEGLVLAWLSWLIAWPLSLPAGRLMVMGLQSIIGDELAYNTSLVGPLYWLGIVTVLAIIASWFPARSASRLSVRESLAYQ